MLAILATIAQLGRTVTVQQQDPRRVEPEQDVLGAEVAEYPALVVEQGEREGQLSHQNEPVGLRHIGQANRLQPVRLDHQPVHAARQAGQAAGLPEKLRLGHVHQESADAAPVRDEFPRPGEVRVQLPADSVVRVGQIPTELDNRPGDVARSARAEVQVLLVGERLGPDAKQSVAVD
ncbi:MAG: hypothetical protein ACRDP7_21705, partial [Trebonia sp.]